MDRIVRNLRNHKSWIRNYLGGASFGCGLICFAYGETYDKTFGKLGYGGPFVYVAISLSIIYLIWGFKRFKVPERYQVRVEAILYVMICFISVQLDTRVPGKSDALSIISYASFTLASVFMSWKSELGFGTGFFALFQSLFSESLFKITWKFSPIILAFGFITVFLRHYGLDSSSSNGDDGPQEDVPLINAAAPTAHNNDEHLDLEGQYIINIGQVPGESISSTNYQQNNEEGFSQIEYHSLSNNNGPVLEESISNNEQEETPSSSSLTYLEGQVSSGNSGSEELELISPAAQGLRGMQEEDSTWTPFSTYTGDDLQDQASSSQNISSAWSPFSRSEIMSKINCKTAEQEARQLLRRIVDEEQLEGDSIRNAALLFLGLKRLSDEFIGKLVDEEKARQLLRRIVDEEQLGVDSIQDTFKSFLGLKRLSDQFIRKLVDVEKARKLRRRKVDEEQLEGDSIQDTSLFFLDTEKKLSDEFIRKLVHEEKIRQLLRRIGDEEQLGADSIRDTFKLFLALKNLINESERKLVDEKIIWQSMFYPVFYEGKTRQLARAMEIKSEKEEDKVRKRHIRASSCASSKATLEAVHKARIPTRTRKQLGHAKLKNH